MSNYDADAGYLLGLEVGKIAADDLMALNGKSFAVKKMQSEWRKMVVITDEITVTNITAQVSISSCDIEISSAMIYCDFYLKGKYQYNAWLSLGSIKEYVLAAHK